MRDQTATGREKIPTRVFSRPEDANLAVAQEIATLIRQRAANGRRCVLGFATGSTPTGVYAELVRLHKEEGLSFANVISFNLDEYLPMRPDELQSYHRFMREHLFDHVDIAPDNARVPSGTIPIKDVAALAVSRRLARVGAGGHRDGRAPESLRAPAEAQCDLQAPEPEGPGDVSRRRPARVLGACRGAESADGPAV
jgi:hypothetical protein